MGPRVLLMARVLLMLARMLLMARMATMTRSSIGGRVALVRVGMSALGQIESTSKSRTSEFTRVGLHKEITRVGLHLSQCQSGCEPRWAQ
jgi:hypothetical protein